VRWRELKVWQKLRSLMGRRQAPSYSSRWPDAEIGSGAIMETIPGCPISIGRGTKIADGAVVSTETWGEIIIGERCEIYRGALLLTYGGRIKIGDDCSVNPYSVLYGHGGLTIGNGVRIAAHTVIIPANHGFSDVSRPIYQQSSSKKGIVIEDDVWIGTGVRILDGVTIRTGAVIGAGAVVTKDVPPFTVNAGVPSRVIADRKADPGVQT
jgi:acetyltransferase-like isoleucine patch superfamily enzyme